MKRSLRFTGFLACLVLVCAVTVGATGKQETKPGAEFVYAGYFDIPTLDAHATDSGTALNMIMQVCENLTGFKPGTSEIVPQLAERYEVSDDMKTYTFSLRKGIQFTDGAPFNAEAVKINIARVIALGKGPSSRLAEIDGVKVLDNYTVQIILTQPSNSFLYRLTAKAGLHIMSPKALEEHKTKDDPWAENWFSKNPVGTGPYKLFEWVAGDRVILIRNEDYWQGWKGKHLDTIIRRTVPEYTTRKLLLEQGKAHLIDNPVPDDLSALKQIPGVKIQELPTINVGWYPFIFNDEVMQNIELRKALSWAFPYKEAAEIAGLGSTQLQGPMPKSIPGHNNNLFVYQTDLDKARQHLKAAGYQPGVLKLTLVHSVSDRNRRIYEVFYTNLQQIGVTLKVEEMAWGQFSPWMAQPDKKGSHVTMIAHWPDYPEPSAYLTLYFKNTKDNPPACPRGYRNESLNTLFTKAAEAMDKEKKNEYYKQAQEIIVNDALGIWAFQFFDAIAMRDSVKGFVFTPANFGIYDFYYMYLEQ